MVVVCESANTNKSRKLKRTCGHSGNYASLFFVMLIKILGIIFIMIMLSNFSYSQTENKQTITNDTIVTSLLYKSEFIEGGVSEEEWNTYTLHQQKNIYEMSGGEVYQAVTDQYNRMVEESKKLINDTIQKKK